MAVFELLSRGRWIACGLALVGLSMPMPASSGERVEAALLLQASPLAGFQYHEGKRRWAEMRVGDALQLIREPDNRYDARAVRVEWRAHKLGYVPRADNEAVARLLDRGARLDARIVRLKESRNPWERVFFEVYVTDSLR